MANSESTAEPDPIRARIRAAGLRSTTARIAVMRVLGEVATPVSHAEVAEKLASAGFDRVTVYRNPVELADAGLATRVDLGDHTWRFELRRESDIAHVNDHPHFVCVDCGQVSCLPGVSVSVKTQPEIKAPRLGEITEVLLKGHCANCS